MRPAVLRGKALNYDRASDPWQSFGPDGTAYAVGLPFDADFVKNGLGVAVSHDGGRSWGQTQDIDPLVARTDTGDPSDDKQSVTADPLRPGYAYIVWDQLQDIFPPCPAVAASQRAPIRSGHDAAGARRAAASKAPTSADPCPGFIFTGPAMFSRTVDGGVTWSKPQPIVATAVNEQTIGNPIVVDHQTGFLYDFFNYIDGAGRNNIEMVVSVDMGQTWSKPSYVQRLFTTAETRACGCGVVDPRDPNKRLRTGDIIPEVAIDPNSGQLYVVWQDGRPNGFRNDMLYISTSTNHGLTWSAPKLVNQPGDKAAFTGAVSVDSQGRVGILYYAFTPPLVANPDILLTDVWLQVSDGPGLNFGARTQAGGPFNIEAAPVARGFFTGDYMGLAAKVGNPGSETAGNQVGPNGGGGQQSGSNDSAFVTLFTMTNCADISCTAVGTVDGSPAGPDSTDTYTSHSQT